MTPCPRCGVQPPLGALFCPSCGTRIVAELDAATPKVAWDTSRPALPDDLFRAPEDEPLAVEDPGPGADYEVYRRPGPAAPRDDDPTLVRHVPVPPPPARPAPRAYAPGTPEADLLPSERRPYIVPAPVGPSRANLSGARGVMILLGVLVLIAAMGGFLWFSGGGAPTGSSGATTAKSASGTASSAKASGSASGSASATAPKTPSGTPADKFPPAGSTLCQASTTVAVNSTTSCEFATIVAAAIPSGASGTFVVTATSPVTQKEYEMTCVKGTYTVCTGGNNAMVFVK
ncbi:MAG: hypothetical protein ACOH16_08095 [Propionibacteriaceae bacterium]